MASRSMPTGKLQRFTGLVIGDDGKVEALLQKGQKRAIEDRASELMPAGGQCCPG